MATLQELTVKIGAETDGLDKIDQAAGKIDSNFQKVRDSGKKVTDVGKGLTAGVTTPVVGLGTAVLKTASDFEAGMNGVRAVTGATGSEFEALQDKAREMGATTAFSATESANAMEFLGMAGWDTTEIMSGLPDVLNLAAAGGMELADAADVSSNIMSGFGIEASEAARVSDVLAEAAASANVDVGMLGESMKYAAPLASEAGWSLEETAGAVGLLGDAGIQGSEAGTGLNSILATLADTSSTGAKELEAFGVSAMDSSGQVRPLTDLLGDLADEGADVGDVLRIFGLEAGPKLQALLGRGSDGLQELITDLENSEGAAQEMKDIRMEGLEGQLKTLSSAAQELMLQIADTGLLSAVTSLVEKVTEWTQGLNETNPELLKWGTIIAGIAAALGPLLIVVGMTISAIGQIGSVLKIVAGAFRIAAAAKMLFNAALWASPITWIVIGIIALIAVIILVIVYWDEIAAAASAAWDWVVSATTSALTWLGEMVASGMAWIIGVVMGWASSLGSLVSGAWDTVAGLFSSAVSSALGFASSLVSGVLGFIAGLAALPGMVGGYFSNMVSTAAGWISNLISQAAQIPGRIMGAVGNLGSLLVNAGRNVIQGLINGIRGMISNVGSAMSNVASTIRSYLPFSPAEVGPMSGSGAPEVSGGRIAETLGDGIMSELSRVDRAADALMAPLDDRVASMQNAAGRIPANVSSSASRVEGGQEQRVVIDVTGADGEMRKLIRRMVRSSGGNVQQVLGQ